MFRMKRDTVGILWHIGLILFLSWLIYKWEFFNYATTHDPLTALFGVNNIISILATVVVGVDIAFMSHSVLRAFVWKSDIETIIDSLLTDKVATAMLTTWSMTTFVDTFATWFYLSARMEINGITSSIPSAMIQYRWIFPIVFAVISWIAQGTVILTIARSIQAVILMLSMESQQSFKPNQKQQQNNRPQSQVQHVAHNNNQQRQQQNNKPKPIPRPEYGRAPDPRQQTTYRPVGMNEPAYEPIRRDITNYEPLDFGE